MSFVKRNLIYSTIDITVQKLEYGVILYMEAYVELLVCLSVTDYERTRCLSTLFQHQAKQTQLARELKINYYFHIECFFNVSLGLL